MTKNKIGMGATALVLASTLVMLSSHAVASAEIPEDPAALCQTTCAICHERPETKAPAIETLRQLPFSRILQTLEIGIMQPQAAALKPEQRQQIAK